MTSVPSKKRLPVSVGVCVYNEEKNIVRLLHSLLAQKTNIAEIREIIIVSSGSTDKTDAIASDFIKRYSNIKLLTQEKREGKSSALNLFFENATQDILVSVNGDILLQEDTIEKLVLPFCDPEVGMTGGHTIPVNDKNHFLGFTVHLLWNLHHLISLKNPKLGELIALRNMVRIPGNIAFDEAWLEASIKSRGLKLIYVPDAVLFNKGPDTVSDFLKQRRRNFAGNLYITKKTGHKLSTMNSLNVLILTLKGLKFNSKVIVYTFGAILLEMLGRALGFYDFYVKKRNPVIWEVIKTTKEM
ncbi:MAG: glycosyltransferase [Candidatus Methanoperedens sp.]|nr:glycosyltransferase [Candidatus Methanoperedens sp.]